MLDISWSTILWEILNFLIIAVALYYLVFKPMAKRAEKRALEKAELLANLKADSEEAEVKLQEINERLENLDVEIEAITDAAYEKNRVLQDELLTATREEAEMIIVEAVREARKDQYLEIKKRQSSVVDTILEISKETLKPLIVPQIHASLIEELSKKIWDLGKEDMALVQTIRDSLEERLPTITITVAEALTREQHVNLYNTLNALSDKDIEMEVEVNPELIAGIKARVGDIVFDNSILAHFNHLAEEVNNKLEQLDIRNNE